MNIWIEEAVGSITGHLKEHEAVAWLRFLPTSMCCYDGQFSKEDRNKRTNSTDTAIVEI